MNELHYFLETFYSSPVWVQLIGIAVILMINIMIFFPLVDYIEEKHKREAEAREVEMNEQWEKLLAIREQDTDYEV